MGAKFIAYSLTHSNAILTDALESIVNIMASSFAFYSIYLASMPKDENHPYGHGKVEFFSAFFEGALIFIAGLLIVGKAIYNLYYPAEIHQILDGMGILAITGVVNFVLGRYLIQKSKDFNSITLFADGKHLQTDAYSTLGLLVGLSLFYITKIVLIDTLLSLVLGLYILYSGYKLLRTSVGGLMDESDVEMVGTIIDILQENRRDAWIDVHNLRIQRYGNQLHVDCHVTLPNYFNLIQVHDEVSAIDTLVNQNTNIQTELFIHADPCIPQCCHYCRVKNCPIRSEDKIKDIEWNLMVVTNNKKHFVDEKQDNINEKGN
jgi:cation diffusion facilitator family transporter